MNSDIIVCGVVSDEVVSDIGIVVPKGEATVIPGVLAHQSKVLWRMLSQQKLFQLNVNSLVKKRNLATARSADTDEFEKVQAQLAEAQAELQAAQVKLKQQAEQITLLNEELNRVRAELSSASVGNNKLDSILDLLKSGKLVVPTSNGASNPSNGARASASTDFSLEDVPMYIPSQIKSETSGGQVEIKEGSSDATPLAATSKALKSLRKKTTK